LFRSWSAAFQFSRCARALKSALLLQALLFELVQRSRPVLFQQPRQRAVREQPSARLAIRAVVGFICRIDDALDRCAAVGTRLPVTTVNRHAFAKGRHLFGEALT